jgi:DNA-binding NarL/FixJ family response regulator
MRMNAEHEGSIRIALIEPEAGDVAWISELARAGDSSVAVTDEIAAERPDIEEAAIILLGLQRLGDVEIEALTRLHAGFPKTPVIVLAGPDVAARAGEAVGFGAQHVTAKIDLTSAKLSSLIRYYTAYARARAASCVATA